MGQKVKPLHDRMIVKRLAEEKQTKGGLIIPDTAKEKPQQGKVVAVGAGNTFIAAMQQHRIDAGMTTEPTISRLVKTGVGKVLIDLRTPESTRAALGADYPFIGIFMMSSYVASHKSVVQRSTNQGDVICVGEGPAKGDGPCEDICFGYLCLSARDGIVRMVNGL